MTDAAPDDRILLIKSKAGLGNRMLAAATGIVYAELAGRRPVLDWRDGQYAPVGTNAYPLLFTPPADAPGACAPEAVEGRGPVTPAIWQDRLERHPQGMIDEFFGEPGHTNPRIYRKLCVDLSRIDQPEPVAVFWSYLPKFARLGRLLAGDKRFARRPERSLIRDVVARWFQPNARVTGEVDRLFAGLQRPVIGVHIRYSDLQVPLEPIEAALRKRRAAEPGAPIYLATDNAEIQQRIRASFENVHTIEKWLPEDGKRLHGNPSADLVREGENALIDMWALSRCDRLIYSRKSTFSATSAMIGDFASADLTDVDRYSPKVLLSRFVQARL